MLVVNFGALCDGGGGEREGERTVSQNMHTEISDMYFIYTCSDIAIQISAWRDSFCISSMYRFSSELGGLLLFLNGPLLLFLNGPFILGCN